MKPTDTMMMVMMMTVVQAEHQLSLKNTITLPIACGNGRILDEKK